MRIIFTGRDNSFNRKYISELFKEHEILCCMFLENDRFTLKARFDKINRRIKKYGLLRVLDELAFHLFNRIFLQSNTEKDLFRTKTEYFINSIELNCPLYKVENIHSERWLRIIREIKPDLIFNICSNVIFKPILYSIPRLGTYVLHECLTPEYRGLHTPIWALLNKDYDYLGFSLIRVNDEIDGGDILVQNRYKLKENEGIRTWGWIGHIALIEGLPLIREALKRLEKDGNFKPIETKGRKSNYFTWMQLSVFLKKILHQIFNKN